MGQLNIFGEMYDTFKFDKNKPIKLFEAFSGYGSQQMALKRLGLEVDVVGYSEIDKYAIQVYKALHGVHKNYGGIGSFERLPKGIDICTWSFPCTDISLAGNQKGMKEGTRSNYGYVFLDTVENTPKNERPKVLLMENVKALFSNTFVKDWRLIQKRLEDLGYTSYSKVLNAKDYGVAQNRERVFIVSILGKYSYDFPKPFKLEKRLRNYLEEKVDEKYYLSDKLLKFFIENSKKNEAKGNGFRFKPHNIEDDKPAYSITTNTGSRMDDNFIIKTWNDKNKIYKIREDDMTRHRIYDTKSVGVTITTNESQQPSILIPEATKQGYAESYNGDGVYINRPHQKMGVVQKGMIQTLKTSCNDIGVIDNSRIRKLTPREAFRLMDVDDNDIDIILNQVSNTQAYKLAGNSIVVNVLVEIFKQLF